MTINADKEVDRLFNELDAVHGTIARNPVTGGEFVWGIDPLGPQKELARQALEAREHFYLHGPRDAPPLPVSEQECEDYRNSSGCGLRQITGFYARSLEANEYDFSTHPSFDDFARGLMACNSGLWGIEKNEEMKKRFPPRPLDGIGPGRYWEGPQTRRRAA